MDLPSSPSNRPRLGSFDQRLADFDTFSPGPSQYACALYEDPGATLDNLRQAVTTLEEAERTVRRVLGGANRTTVWVVFHAEGARAALRALRWRYLEEASPRTIEAALSYLEEASPEALATHRVRLVALADRALVAPQPSPVAPRDDEDALDEDYLFLS